MLVLVTQALTRGHQGKAERDLCYEPMKEALLKHFESVSMDERYRGIVLALSSSMNRYISKS